MTPTSGDENPYQPPKADAFPAESGKRLEKRPASSKWILFFTTLLVGLIGWAIFEKGLVGWLRSQAPQPWRLFIQLYFPLSWLALCYGHPRRLAYCCGVVNCLFMISILIFAAMRELAAYPDPWASREGRGSVIAFTIFGALCYWLFHRFTFGLPSRRYYGMAPASQD